MQLNLDSMVNGQVFPFMLVFCRLGAGLMMFPGIGEAFVTPRIRMLFALALCFLMLPILGPMMPAMPAHPADLVKLMFIEIMVGLFFGTVMRLLMNILETAGAVIGMEIGLSNASILNPSLASESALPAAFLGVTAIALIFATGLEQLLFRALLDTYKVFPVGLAMPIGEITSSFVHLMTKTFAIGIQIAAPFIAMGLLIYVVMGIMQRLMPQIQLFLVVIPVQIWGGFFVFALSASLMLGVWLGAYDEIVVSFFVRPG